MTHSNKEFGPVIEMFWDKAAEIPGAVALARGDASITFGSLAEYVKDIAARLNDYPLERNSVIALKMRRSVQQVGAMLATLEVGCAFVLIDPDTGSDERTQTILRDAEAALLITNSVEEQPGVLPGCPDVEPITHCGPVVADTGQARPILPEEMACVIYTSGSTGVPKGAVITQRGLANRMRDAILAHGFTTADRFLYRSNVGFDGAVWEVLGALLSGASLVLADGDLEGDPDAVVRAVGRFGVTVLQAVPTMLKRLLKSPDAATMPTLRMILAVGERLDQELAESLSHRLQVELWNCYGPTECTISVTEHLWVERSAAANVPIGRAIRGTGLHVLDDELQEVGVGGTGELYVSGQGLGRGYLKQPALTAERFVPSTLEPGRRMYRTGDRVKRLAGGVLEHLGRTDDQLKVNGVRIEPTGIEEVIRRHPAVVDAAVFLRTRGTQPPYLAAAIVDDGTLDIGELRSFLRARLSRGHLPSLITKLPTLPTTASGKVDRSALDDAVGVGETTDHAEPRDRYEKLIVAAWQAALGKPHIGRSDDFFQLGGTSLGVPVVMAHIRQATGLEVSIIDLYEMSTVVAQARMLRELSGHTEPADVAGAQAVYPLSPAQEQIWFADQLSGRGGEYVVSLVLEVQPERSLTDVRGAFATVASRHAGLRITYAELDGDLVQVLGPVPAVEVNEASVDASSATGLICAEIERGFDIKAEPVWRALLIKRPQLPSMLLVTAHHIASDGWSMAIIERELTVLLGQEGDVAAASPGTAAHTFGEIAEQQRKHQESDAFQQQVAYWKKELAGVFPVDVPADHPRPAIRDPRAMAVTMTLHGDAVEGLLQVGRHAGASPYVVVLSLYVMTLANYTSHSEVTIATLSSGRTKREYNDVIGYFVNTLLVRVGLDGSSTFTDLVKLAKRKFVEAVRNQDVPYAVLVEQAAYPYDRSRNSGLEAVFNWRDTGVSGSESDFLTSGAGTEVERRIIGDMVLNVQHDPQKMVFVLEYSTALYHRSTMERFLRFFAKAAERVAADPEIRLSDVVKPAADDRSLRDQRLGDGPEPDRGHSSVKPASVQPDTRVRSALEEELIVVCEELLGIKDMDVEDDIFRLGGNSVRAIRLRSIILRKHNVNLSLQVLFESRTIRKIAEQIAAVAQ